MNVNFFKEKFYGQSISALLPLKEKSWEECIYNLYKEEVEKSGRIFLENEHVKENIQMLAEWIRGEYSSCLITGTVGIGKTALLKSIMRLFDILRDPITIPPLRCRSLVLYDASELCNKYMSSDDVRYEVLNCKALFIDDLGTEGIQYFSYGNVCKPINDIILARYAARLPTIVPTNLNLGEFANRYGDRVSDRLNEIYAMIECPKHESYRRMPSQKKQEDQTIENMTTRKEDVRKRNTRI